MGLAIGIFIITAGFALAVGICMGSVARGLWNRAGTDRRPGLKKLLAVLFGALAAGSAAAVFLCVWAAWSCLQAGLDIFG